MASGQTQSNPVYKLKRIDFFGRKVPIALQNENGPCPLLAIANILLLKKQIVLPEHAPDVSQNRLVSLVAGHLLDANDEQKVGKGLPEEYKANLRKNVADAIGILSKLTTGIDVNVRFHDVKGFEFTDEIAIFDLMDISLVHGWLVDPEDTAAAASLGQRSYNEVVEQLVMILGDATPKRLITPQLSRRTSGFSTPRRTSSGLGTVAASELLSPTEVAPNPKPILPISCRTEPSSSAESAPCSAAAAASTLDLSKSERAASSEGHVTPTGALTSSEAHQPHVSDAAQAGGPTGSLVSAQRTATVTDSDPASATQSLVSHQSQNTRPQAQVAMISPAAEMASRAYPLPAPPLEGEGLTTPQNSTNYDAHIPTAPTPYPSLASELSQATNSPISSKGIAMSGAFPPAGQGPFDSPTAAANNGRSRFVPSDMQQLAEGSRAATTSQAQPATSSPTAPEASDAFTSVYLKAQASTAEPDVKAAHYEGMGLSALDQSAEDLSLSDLKLDTADDEQLQLALAISLGQQQAEEAQALAQDTSISQSKESSQPPEADSADTAASAEGKHAGHSHAARGSILSKNGKAESAPVTAAVAAAAAGSTNTEPRSHEPGYADANQAANTSGGKAAAGTGAGQASTTNAQQPQGSTAASAEPSAAHPDVLQEHQLNLLSPNATAQSSSSTAVDEQQQQQPLVKTPSGTEAGTAGPRMRTTSEQEERSNAAAQAHLIQDFLDNSSSQLTYHGLASLREGLRPNELAVFFRNNHFNTIFLHKGVVHILVTDQGYEFEKNVVWEKLDDLMGNTQFLKADFTPYGSNSLAEQVSDAADLVQAAFAGVGPNKSQATDGAVDADFALALQLQEEEQCRAAREQQSRHQGQQQQQQQQGHCSAGQARQQQSSNRSSQSRSGSHGRPPSGRSAEPGVQSYANPIMQRQHRQGGSQQAQQQQPPEEKSSVGSAFAKFFGWGTKK